jgi:hypothetical protein
MKIACLRRRRSSLARYVKKNMSPLYGPAGCAAVTRAASGVTLVQPRYRKAGGMRDDFSEEEEEAAGDQPGLPWPATGPPPPPDPRGQRTRKGLLLVAIALIAAAAGFLVVTAVHDVSANPASASGSPTSSPQSELPSEGTGNGTGPLQIPSTGPGQTLRLEVGGRVTAVSATSITLGAHGQSVTATVTKATTITGKVASISGIKVGDLVSAQITGTNGKLTATAIQDPASIP